MKTLTLLRHAKSGWDDPALRDFDRPLNAKGRRAAALVGRNLRALDLAFDHVAASPAVRVAGTLEEVERGYGTTLAPAWDRRLYLASVASLLDVIGEFDAGAASALVVGHNPGLEELVLALVPEGQGGALRDAVEVKFPTASVATITFDSDDWAGAKPGAGRLIHFVRPRDLDPTLGPDAD